MTTTPEPVTEDGLNIAAELRHWFFQTLTPEQREGFMAAVGGKGFPLDLQYQVIDRVAAALNTETARSGELREIADFLTDQRNEPWPSGSESDRLHYWRDKAIEAARRINALSKSNGEKG